MHRRMSNLTKDIMFVCAVIFVILFAVFAFGFWVGKSYAEPISNEREELNKAYNEQQIYQEIRYFQMWEYTENMTDEEYNKTFFEEAE